MNLYKDILEQLLSKPHELVEMTCFQALCKIKAILEDESLEDADCYAKIEEVLCVLEAIGSNGGSRHLL